jgi:heme exporter protein C
MIRRSLALPFLAVAGVMGALALIFLYAPTEAVQGDIQRLFYVHAASGWNAYLAFFVVAGASVMVLARRNDWERWDRMAVAGAEVGVLFTTLVLTTGPIWAGRAWGTWWVWDARTTSTLVLWLIYAGYLLFRTLSPPGERRARLAAVIGLIGAVDIPVVHFAVTWWRTQHPEPTVLRPGGPDLPGSMFLTLGVTFLAFMVLFVALLVLRMNVESSRTRVELALEGARV